MATSQTITRQIALLWQDQVLRREEAGRHTDEVETTLSYLCDIFLPVLPRSMPAGTGRWAAPFYHPSCARQLDRRSRRQSVRDCRFAANSRSPAPPRQCSAVDAVNTLGMSFPSRPRHVQVSEALLKLAGPAMTKPEPIGRALSPRDHRHIYARLAATYQKLTGRSPAARPAAVPPSLCQSGEFRWRAVSPVRWPTRGEGPLATGGALGQLIRAVETFGFHLTYTHSTCARTAQLHERVIARLLKAASPGVMPRCPRDEARRAAPEELADARPLTSLCEYSEETASRLAIVHARRAHALRPPVASRTISCRWPSRCPTCSRSTSCSRKPVYLPGDEPQAHIIAIPLFRTISDLEGSAGDHGCLAGPARSLPRSRRGAGIREVMIDCSG